MAQNDKLYVAPHLRKIPKETSERTQSSQNVTTEPKCKKCGGSEWYNYSCDPRIDGMRPCNWCNPPIVEPLCPKCG